MKNFNAKRAVLVSALCLFSMVFSLYAGADNNTFANPDFAFPKDVVRNAQAELESALKSSRSEDALLAVVQIAVAQRSISYDSIAPALELFDKVNKKLPAPYASLGMLLQARFYTDLYRSRRWVFDSRTLPADSIPEDPMFWDGKMFRNRVNSLISTAVKGVDASASSLPLSDFPKLIVDTKGASEEGYVLLDFVTNQAVSCLQAFDSRSSERIIPFQTSESAQVSSVSGEVSQLSLLRNLVAFHKNISPDCVAAGRAYVAFAKSEGFEGDELASLIARQLREYSGTGAAIPLALEYYSSFIAPEFGGDSPSIRPVVEKPMANNVGSSSVCSLPLSAVDFYNYCRELAKSCSGFSSVGIVSNIVDTLESEAISYQLPSLVLPDTPLQVSLSRKNVADGYLLLMKANGNHDNISYRKISSLLPSSSLVEAIPLKKLSENTPYIYSDSVALPPLSPGFYFLLPSKSSKLSGVNDEMRKRTVNLFNVSAISIIYSPDAEKGRAYVVDARTQAPVKGAKVFFTDGRGRNKKTLTIVTDSEGSVKIPIRNGSISTLYKGSYVHENLYCYSHGRGESGGSYASILPDLAILRPNQTVEFAVILYDINNNLFSLSNGISCEVRLLNANGEKVASSNLTTDDFGRSSGKFLIPDNGLLGSWGIEVVRNNHRIGYVAIQVEEYKAPEFFVTVDPVSDDFSIGKDLKLSGSVVTYSGMPLSGSKVSYKIEFTPRWRWGIGVQGNPASFGGTVTTDDKGIFSIVLPTRNLVVTPYELGRYSIVATATSPSGETQQSERRFFALAKAYNIIPGNDDRILADSDSVRLTAKVTDMSDHPVIKRILYSVYHRGSSSAVLSGEFDSPVLAIPAAKLPSGVYDVVYVLDNDSVKSSFTVWRLSDKKPPMQTSLWVPETTYTAKPSQKNVDVRVGASYDDEWVLMAISDKSGLKSARWIRPKGGVISVSVPAPEEGNRIWVNFLGMHDFASTSESVKILPASEGISFKVETVSFRDKITAGSKEHWKFRFVSNSVLGIVPASAVMYNKALDHLMPSSWNFNPMNSIWFGTYPSFNVLSSWNQYNSYALSVRQSRDSYFANPVWQLYGAYLGHVYVRGNGKMYSKNMMSNAVQDTMVEATAVEFDSARSAGAVNLESAAVKEDSADEGSVSQSSADGDSVKFREDECPLAFFMPDLVSDSDGSLSIDFTAPDFNTTWAFRLLGYTPQGKSTQINLEAVASKRVMVSGDFPSFLRTGDEVVLAATLYNNSEETLSLGGYIEVFDLSDGKVLASTRLLSDMNGGSIAVAPSASRVINLNFRVPYNLSAVGVRTVAESGASSDGEQTAIPVLPSSQPVIESDPFYLSPSQKDFSFNIPSLNDDSSVTLRYCDNPVWYCLTALPDIVVPESESALRLSSSLFGNCVGGGIINRYPELRNGLKLAMSPADGDSLLISNLAKDGQLKVVALQTTPWVNNAAAETMRMSRLSSLLDDAGVLKSVRDVWNRLERLRNSDGGWSWCPGMQSSSFITSRVLLTLGMIKQMHYADGISELDRTAASAVKYCDSEYVSEYRRKPELFRPISMLNYLYARSFFSLPDLNSDFYKIRSLAISEILKSWKSLSVIDKATSAIILARSGRKDVAAVILESLSQYATYVPDRGMWYDNLRSSWNSATKLLITTRVLKAFCEISPAAPEVDRIRQWLVLQRQTEDWGSNFDLAEVVNAILTSGSKWTSTSESPVLSLGNRQLQLTELERLTGSFSIDISPSEASGKVLTVSRKSDGPAWGGVISQFIAPMKNVKRYGNSELNVSKSFYVVSSDGNGSVASRASSFRKGDRIRVTVEVEASRDMDYVVLTDNRPACLQPADQISGYDSVDGVWCYREIRNSSTQLFFPHLSKGKFVLAYDCFAQADGDFSAGLATVQCLYAPMISAHSAGSVITVK